MRTQHLPRTQRQGRARAAGETPRPKETPGGTSRRDRFRAAVTGLSPILLLIGIVYHPYLEDLRDKGTVADALTADTARWGFAHLMVGLATALVVLAFLSVHAFLRESGQSGVSDVGVPFIVVGSVLFAFLPAMEIAMLGAYGAGSDVEEVLLEMNTWFQPLLLASAAVFAVGVAWFAAAIARSRVLPTPVTRLVVVALGIAAITRFIPLGAALYLGGAALALALLPIAVVMATRPPSSRPPHGPREGAIAQTLG